MRDNRNLSTKGTAVATIWFKIGRLVTAGVIGAFLSQAAAPAVVASATPTAKVSYVHLKVHFHPFSMAVIGHKLYVGTVGEGVRASVVVLNAQTGALVKVFGSSGYPFGQIGVEAQVVQDGSYLLVGGAGVAVMKISTGKVLRTLNWSLPYYGFGACFTASGNAVFAEGAAGAANHDVVEFSLQSGAEVRDISGSQYDFWNPCHMVVQGDHVFVSNLNANAVTEFNATSGAFIRLLVSSQGAYDGPITVNGSVVAVAHSTNQVDEFSSSTGNLIRVIGLPEESKLWADDISSLAFDEGYIFAADNANGTVMEVDPQSGALVRVISGFSKGSGWKDQVVPDGPDLFVVSPGSSSISEVNVESGSLIRIISGPS